MPNNMQKYDLPGRHNTATASRIKTISALAPAFILAAALASCGGGGGGTTTPAPTYQGTATSVLPCSVCVTYTADDLSISDDINAASSVPSIRQGAGAGLLARNKSLDEAAGNHAAFLVDNNLLSQPGYLTTLQPGGILGGHYESSSGTVEYTGASPQARATKAGYAGTVTELMTFGAADGAACVASLEDSVYHAIALVSPFIDMGIGFNAGTGSGSACAIELGVKNTTLGQLPTAAAGPVVYPYGGQTGVLPTFHNQAEVPVPAPGLSSAGHPVVVSLYNLTTPTLSASDIVINTFSITPDSGGSPLTVQVLANAGVTTPGFVLDSNIPFPGFVVLLPTVPLAANTKYNLSFSATVKGQTVSKDWSFTTGAAN